MKNENEASVSVCASADISSKTALIQAVECPPLGRLAASEQGVSLLTFFIPYPTHIHKNTCKHTH